MAITQKIIEKIIKEGALTLDAFMSMALNDENFGYYKHNNPFGKRGDFITSPEVSQIFGELIGLWVVETWLSMGKPKVLNLVELGAGKGTLQDDILRTISQIALFQCDFKVHIVEINHTLRKIQKETLQNYGNISWYEEVAQLNLHGETIIISNEFFDALPIKQYNYINDKWYELFINVNSEKAENSLFFFNKQISQEYSALLPKMPLDSFSYESSPKAMEIFKQLLGIISKNKGAILTIDYGYFKVPGNNSFRGFKNHTVFYKQDILDNLDNMDLTANVNFKELQSLVESTMEIICSTQREFLQDLGINIRLEKLSGSNVDKQIQTMLQQQVDILISKEKMGDVFKVMIVKNI